MYFGDGNFLSPKYICKYHQFNYRLVQGFVNCYNSECETHKSIVKAESKSLNFRTQITSIDRNSLARPCRRVPSEDVGPRLWYRRRTFRTQLECTPVGIYWCSSPSRDTSFQQPRLQRPPTSFVSLIWRLRNQKRTDIEFELTSQIFTNNLNRS